THTPPIHTTHLEDGWTPVIETDVDGPNALPLRLDRDTPTLGRYSATRRVARTIYFGSAPTQAAANRGIDDRSIKLGCVQPGETPATFGDALRRLTDQATYLYVDGQRYWYSLQPSVTRLAHDRAASHFTDDDVDEQIRERLETTNKATYRGGFARVHTAPRSPSDVPDEPEVRLVVLGPEHPHSGKSADSPARVAAELLLDQRAAGHRLHRNMLVFLAPDKSRLAELRQGVREFLAWQSIENEQDTLELGNFQRKQVETKRKHFDDAVDQRVKETFVWVLVPSQGREESTVIWDETRVSGPDQLAVRVTKKLHTEESLIAEYSGVRLRMDLDRVPLWRGDHVGLRQLWSDYSQYLYLPRLRDSGVLCGAIQQGVGLLTWNPDTFAYASAVDDATGRYTGLVAGENATVVIDTTSVIVKPDVAARQIAQDRPLPEIDGGGAATTGEAAVVVSPSIDTSAPVGPTVPTRFYGRVSLEPVRMLRDLGDIAEAIVAQLGRANADVVITLEVEASATKGFDDDVRRTVSENARTLKFDTHEFED
ncbi:MAG: AAA+ family ATPase, partial [Egibacteraceae bacterium]